jgi:transposase-like protein
MLSDKKESNKKIRVRKASDSQQCWGDDQKIDAVKAYVTLGGNVAHTSLALQIPPQTLRNWTKTQWWKDLYEEIKHEDNIVMSHRLQKIVSRSMDLVEDRLEKGDFFYDQKTGKVVRKEISLRDAHEVMRTSAQMRDNIEKPQAAVLEESSVVDKLSQLAKQFEQFATAQKNKPPVEVTDVVYITEEPKHAVHEEDAKTIRTDADH